MTADTLFAWTPTAIVFDCDGTLMDSERHWEKAREVVLSRHGSAPDRKFAQATKGLHYTECGRMLAEYAGSPALAGQMTEQLLASFRQLVADDPVTMPGATELVRKAAAFAPLAVASNCPRDVVETGLSRAGLLRYFGHVLVPEGEVRPKPYPDVYLEAARLCGAAPGDALAVEDSHCGFLSASRAGLRVLAVGPRKPPHDAGDADETPPVDLWVASLADPDLVKWADSRRP
ncbi:HAD family phosphatase [Streptomyces sp. ME19-01-6]|uniref:HAD family hydrolase n=1 Tax=Streptomyces sp. ME19-01-6 TaxID=3028686 RepID=UPI0029AB9381|nr:HAD family phosphatase [Streptomyces sp. ME19-01-6]MDX3231920.1 HAD family phosphatase [Streptomyces sp. ME19-01-6]